MIFSYSSRGGNQNTGEMLKDGLSTPEYSIAWDDGLLPGVTIATAATVATNQAGSTVTSSCINATTVSGNSTLIRTKTMGAGGTSPATDGGRFQLTTTATLSNSDVLTFSVYVLIQAGSYQPV